MWHFLRVQTANILYEWQLPENYIPESLEKQNVHYPECKWASYRHCIGISYFAVGGEGSNLQQSFFKAQQHLQGDGKSKERWKN